MSVTATADQSAGFVHNATFDPYTQMITIVMPDGTTQTEVDISSIFSLQTATVDTAIIYGVQLGVSVLLMMILAVMTRPEKRRSIIFFLNVCALLFLFIRGVLMCIILHGPYYNFYNWITAWYWDVAHDQRISISGEVLNFLAYVAMESSLFFQVRIVCCTLRTSWRLAVTALTCLVAVAVCAIRFTMMVLNIKIGVIGADTATDAEWDMLNNVAASTNIVIIVSIIFFSLLFVGKLGHAIQQRRSMGMKQFGPMQIIFVMGCQTMFIPAIFGILAFFVYVNSQINSLVPLVVATFLPLSSMWASTNTNNQNIAAPHQVQRNRDIVVGSRGKSTGGTDRYHSDKQLLTADTLVGEYSPKQSKVNIRSNLDSIDLEMQRTRPGDQIQVDQSYIVTRSD